MRTEVGVFVKWYLSSPEATHPGVKQLYLRRTAIKLFHLTHFLSRQSRFYLVLSAPADGGRKVF